MANRVAGPEIEKLIQLLAKLPGLGPRSARRVALHLIKKKDQLLVPLADAINQAVTKVQICETCGNIDSASPCTICTDRRRDPALLVVVEDVSDLWALERAGVVNAAYHVLGGTLSPLDGIGPDDLNIPGLLVRTAKGDIREIILAVNATVEGQTTAHYITDQLQNQAKDLQADNPTFERIRISQLAHGVPIGGELDYLDEGTLLQAIRSRTSFE
ncbi:recombination mediator RecR [Cohaesibacter gelatinilyticus]|uniref:Recombination protein RecR n=1 Tax=Cohaesibacter gelatinilyticus TaxID=372072 RepID=A0A285PJZ7_9HYPH|nr:recombination mediator RecR [Cohaesibacter gelatinilyticus]SNZ21587.1 DNA replication and repair protein RecR [Cohaesibacter gelatinilyticus]